MSKRLVCTTSTGCLDYYNHNYDIRTIRIKIDVNGELLADGTEIKADEFYAALEADKHLVPRTSQPSIGELVEIFEGYADEGYDEVIVTTISSKLSGTYNGVCKAAEMVEDRIKVYPVDTKTVCYAEGHFAITAAKMIEEGKSTEEILKKLEHLKEVNCLMFAVDSLECLVKNGRLSGAAGFIGKYLKIKPLLALCEDGTIQAVEKIRTTKKALEAVCDRFKEFVGDKEYLPFVVYTGPGLRDFFLEVIKEKLGLENILELPCSPVVGCHVGPNAIGLGCFLND